MYLETLIIGEGMNGLRKEISEEEQCVCGVFFFFCVLTQILGQVWSLGGYNPCTS